MKKRIAAIAIACLCLISGLFLAIRVYAQYRESLIEQHEEKLADITNSVDRSAQGFFRIYGESLAYVTGRPGFAEAEAVWIRTGDSRELLSRMEENLMTQEFRIRTMLAIREGEVLLSTDGNTGYQIPENAENVFICADAEGHYYFALRYSGGEMSYAALIEPAVLCEYLAEGSAVSDTDRLVLIDRDGRIVIQHRDGITGCSPLTRELISRSPEIALVSRAVGADTRTVSLYEEQSDAGSTTVGYALLGDRAAGNGFFAVCVLNPYDEYLDTLNRSGVWLMAGFAMMILGVVLLMSFAGALFRENRQASQELKRLEEREKKLEQINLQTRQLAHHQRLETIGMLTSSISHEFNNLLTPIMSYSLMTLEKLPPEEEELSDNLIEIYNASQRAKEIISRLSDLSRKNTPETVREVSLDALVKKTLDIAMPAKPKGVEVKLNLNCWDQRIRANEIQIYQMLLNLILNAFHAMQEQGVLTIDTTFDDHFVMLRVEDDGCGIPKELQEKIYEPFFTTKEPGKGTGLGLAIVAQVVEDHQGTIRVESTPGSGTVFEICLPRPEEAKA